jgi:type II secretory pathway component PulJ
VLPGAGSEAFTLVEVLVSVSLLTIVVGALYASYFSVQRALERYDGVAMRYHEARTTLDIMRREIESAVFREPGVPEAENHAEFVIKDRDIYGKSASVLKLTSYSSRGSGLIEAVYTVEEQDGKLYLTKTERPPSSESVPVKSTMIEDIDSFSVEALFRGRWVKTWNTADTGKLPESVRVSIRFRPESGRFNEDGKIVDLTEYARPMIGRRL